MSFLTTQPEMLINTAGTLAGLGSALSAHNAAAAAPTIGVVAPAAIHQQFVATLGPTLHHSG